MFPRMRWPTGARPWIADKALEAEWNKLFDAYAAEYPDLAEQFKRTQKNVRKDGWEKAIPSFPAGKPVATRNAGNVVMNAIADAVPELFGGAADLTASTKTIFKSSPHFADDPAGRNVFFGVREFGMCAAVNGMAAHGGLVPFGSTFFCFSDYCKPAIRLAALSRAHSLFVFTHDSIGLGEDGPTHQPIEHLMMLRAVPDLTDYRPADANETAACWRLALERTGPCFFALSRQDLPVIDPATHDVYAGVSKGAYVLEDAANPQVILIGTGSEVGALRRSKKAARGRRHRGARSQHAQLGDLRRAVRRVQGQRAARECAQARRRSRIAPRLVEVCGARMETSSASIASAHLRPGPKVLAELGFSAENVAARARKLIKSE